MDYFIVELEQEQKIGIPLNSIQEVISIAQQDICPIPGVKNSLLGVINQRGKLLWLLDLSKLLLEFKQVVKRFNKLTVLITNLSNIRVGLVVQKLDEIKEVQVITNLSLSSNITNKSNYLKSLSLLEDEQTLQVLDLDILKNYLQETI